MPVLLILLVPLVTSLLVVSVLIPLKPEALRITRRFVCPWSKKMSVEKSKLSYHRPGEKGLTVMCDGPDGLKVVTCRAFLCLWFLAFLCAFPVGLVVYSIVF